MMSQILRISPQDNNIARRPKLVNRDFFVNSAFSFLFRKKQRRAERPPLLKGSLDRIAARAGIKALM